MLASRFTFITLILIVLIAGISQGLTLPLLAILLEERGVSSVANGLNAAALYIGVLIVSPIIEIPMRRFGYLPTILGGLLLLTITCLLLPFFESLTIWFFLRLLMGIGDSALHYASQIWVTAIAPEEKRGRYISLYGLAYGVGFSIGPLGINLLPYGLWVPFVALCLVNLVATFMLLRLKNDYPAAIEQQGGKQENRYALVIRLGWLALIPSFLFGYMEAALNGSFPVYALRMGLSKEWVSYILPAFVVGSLILQLPLGTLSDRIGRKKVMIACSIVGAAAFFVFPFAGQSVWLMMVLLAIAGAAVGSFYSLGLAYAADILPSGMVATAGVIAGMNFSIASIIAPNVNGYVIGYLSPGWMFTVMGLLLAAFVVAGLVHRPTEQEKPSKETVVL